MKRTVLLRASFWSIMLAFILIFAAIQSTYAQMNMRGDANDACPAVKWTSSGPNDIISFQNGMGAALAIQISVDDNSDNVGVNLSNCGTATHINSGSTAVCITRDTRFPVAFVTDNPTKTVSGEYRVRVLSER